MNLDGSERGPQQTRITSKSLPPRGKKSPPMYRRIVRVKKFYFRFFFFFFKLDPEYLQFLVEVSLSTVLLHYFPLNCILFKEYLITKVKISRVFNVSYSIFSFVFYSKYLRLKLERISITFKISIFLLFQILSFLEAFKAIG